MYTLVVGLLSLLPLPRVAVGPRIGGWDRRSLLSAAGAAAVFRPRAAEAFIAGSDDEVSGLVVLRIAEVCAFQEKLLRTLAACGNGKPLVGPGPVDQFGNAYCDGQAYSVNPVQIVFGTGVMLKNSNLDGNLKLMINTDVPKPNRGEAVQQAVTIMNTFNKLVNTAGTYTTFESADLLVIADIYADARGKLARFFDLLPTQEKEKFYNYADAVRKYEEKVSSAEGIERMKL